MAGRKKTEPVAVNTTTTTKKTTIVKGKKNQTSGLYDSIKKKCNLDIVLDEWINRYKKEDAEEAVWELLMLIFDCSGATTNITFNQFKDLSIPKASESLIQQADSPTYPLGSKRSKYLIENFEKFWSTLVNKCSQDIIYDDYLLEMISLWLHELSSGAKRGLRYTSTLVGIQIATTIITICNEQRKQLNNVTRQLASESKNSARQKQFKENQISISGKLEKLEKILIVRLFTDVFSSRFKDSLPEMRAMCAAPYCKWILSYPIQLFKDENLKYIGWLLNDFANEPRQAAINGLLVLYSDENYINQLDTFTQRFKHRIVEIAFSDKTPAIAVQAIKLVSLMSSLELLDESDVLTICKLYLVDQPEISKAAGGLIFNKYLTSSQTRIDASLATITTTVTAANGRKKSKTTVSAPTTSADELQQQQIKSQIYHQREIQLNALLEFLEKTIIPDEPYYLVQSLWDSGGKSLFTDWSFWVDYFESIESKNINDKQMGIICKFFNSSVKIAVNDRIKIFSAPQLHHLAQYRVDHQLNNQPQQPISTNLNGEMEVTTTQLPNTPAGKRNRRASAISSKSDNESDNEPQDDQDEDDDNSSNSNSTTINEEACIEITRNFINIIPELLVLYRSNSIVCQNLIEITRYFVLECYVSLRLQSKYSDLLEAICDIFVSQPKTELIDTISATLEHLIHNGKTPSQLETASKTAIHNLFIELTDILRLAKISSQQQQQSQQIQSQESIITSESSQQLPPQLQDDSNEEENQVFPVISALYKLNSLCKQFNLPDEKFASMIFKFTDGSVNGIPIQTIEHSDTIIIYSTSIYSQLLMWSLCYTVPPKFYQVLPMNTNLLQMFYLFSSRILSTLKNVDITHRLRHFIFTTFIETRSLFSEALSLSNMTVYNINLPFESLLQKTILLLFENENKYSIELLKVEFLKSYQLSVEKKKLMFENKSSSSSSSAKRSSAKKSTATDQDTSHSEKETTDHETEESDKNNNNNNNNNNTDDEDNNQINESDLQLLNNFIQDQQFGERAVELVTSVCNCIKFSFTNGPIQLIRVLLKQIAISSCKNATDIIREFIRKYPIQSAKIELEIVIDLLNSFQTTCTSQVIASNRPLQNHMFSRFRSLCQWLVSDFIKHQDTIKGVLDHFINFALKNPNTEKLDELIVILNFLASKLSEKSSIDIIKKKIVFSEDYPHIDLINKLYNTIEFQTIQNLDTGNNQKGGKKTKQQLNFASAASNKKTTTTPTKKRTRRGRSKQVSESEESDESDQEYEEEKQMNINTDHDHEKVNSNNEEGGDDDDEIVSSEASSDFDPSDSKKKLKRN